MENEIKVNDFVRLKDGTIAKVLEIKNQDSDVLNYYCLNNDMGTLEKNIVKHSTNLLDIIQKDDFVNKCRVYEVEEKGIIVYQTVEGSTTDYNWISFDEIEEVVTKEMMKYISYKVKQEEN